MDKPLGHYPNATEIVVNLWLGDRFDAEEWTGNMICVLCDSEIIEPPSSCKRAIRLPITNMIDGKIVVPMKNLNIVADRINELLPNGKVLVFCNSGIERSPLCIAWYLHKYLGYSLGDAYKKVKSIRPIVEDRRNWIV